MQHVLVICLAIGVADPSAAGERPTTVAVVNFANRSQGPAGEKWKWLEKGLADLLITDLSSRRALQVVTREQMQLLVDEKRIELGDEPAEMAGVLKANVVLTGSFLVEGRIITIDGQLTDAGGGLLTRLHVKGAAGDTLSHQKEFSAQAIAALLGKEVPQVAGQLPRWTDSLGAAQRLYQGIDLYDKGQYSEAWLEFRRALSQDDNYADARYWAARMYYFLDRYRHARRAYERFVYEYSTHPRISDAIMEYTHTFEKLGLPAAELLVLYDRLAGIVPRDARTYGLYRVPSSEKTGLLAVWMARRLGAAALESRDSRKALEAGRLIVGAVMAQAPPDDRRGRRRLPSRLGNLEAEGRRLMNQASRQHFGRTGHWLDDGLEWIPGPYAQSEHRVIRLTADKPFVEYSPESVRKPDGRPGQSRTVLLIVRSPALHVITTIRVEAICEGPAGGGQAKPTYEDFYDSRQPDRHRLKPADEAGKLSWQLALDSPMIDIPLTIEPTAGVRGKGKVRAKLLRLSAELLPVEGMAEVVPLPWPGEIRAAGVVAAARGRRFPAMKLRPPIYLPAGEYQLRLEGNGAKWIEEVVLRPADRHVIRARLLPGLFGPMEGAEPLVVPWRDDAYTLAIAPRLPRDDRRKLAGGLARMPTGRLVALGELYDDLWIARQGLGGKWDAPRPVPLPISSVHMEQSPDIAQHADGRYVMTFISNRSRNHEYVPYVSWSRDLRRWSGPVQVRELMSHEATIIQLPRGDWLLAIAGRHPSVGSVWANGVDRPRSSIVMYRSADLREWEEVAVINAPLPPGAHQRAATMGASQPKLAISQSGRIWLAAQASFFLAPPVTRESYPYPRAMVTCSEDGGRTWAKPAWSDRRTEACLAVGVVADKVRMICRDYAPGVFGHGHQAHGLWIMEWPDAADPTIEVVAKMPLDRYVIDALPRSDGSFDCLFHEHGLGQCIVAAQAAGPNPSIEDEDSFDRYVHALGDWDRLYGHPRRKSFEARSPTGTILPEPFKPEFVPTFLANLKADKPAPHRRAAAIALGSIRKSGREKPSGRYRSGSGPIPQSDVPRHAPPEAVRALVAVVREPTPDGDPNNKDHYWLRREAAESLGLMRAAGAVGPLIDVLKSLPHDTTPQRDLGQVISQALGRIGDRRAIPALTATIGYFHEPTAIEALGNVKDPAVLPELMRCMKHRGGAPGRAACLAIGTVGTPEALSVLKEGLASETPEIRHNAVKGLLRYLRLYRRPLPADIVGVLEPLRDSDPSWKSGQDNNQRHRPPHKTIAGDAWEVLNLDKHSGPGRGRRGPPKARGARR